MYAEWLEAIYTILTKLKHWKTRDDMINLIEKIIEYLNKVYYYIAYRYGVSKAIILY